MEGPSDQDDHRTVSENEETHHSEDSDESGSESSEDVNPLLDLEAVESSDDDRDEGDESDDGFGAKSHNDAYHRTFHQFGRLPPELRQRVWEFFDPDLRAPARVFSLVLVGDYLWPAANTAQQTAPARAVLAVHRESRQIALKFYPNTFHFIDKGSVCRFHSSRDVIVLSLSLPFNGWAAMSERDLKTIESLEHVKNLGFDIEAEWHFKSILQNLPFRTPPSLERIYHCWDARRIRARDIRWCLHDTVHAFEVVTEEESPGVGEHYRQLFCWPDLEHHKNYAEAEIPPLLSADVADVCPKGLELWPMLAFSSDRGAQRYIALKVRSDDDPDAEWPSDLSDDSWGSESYWSHPGEYESEGIDDDTIDGNDDTDDDSDGDLIVDGSSPNGRHIGDEDDGGSDFEGFSPSQGDLVAVPSEGLPPARFSSLETDSRDGDIEQGDESGSDKEPAAPANRRARRQVVHSDSEDDDLHDESPKKEKQASRQVNRRGGRVVLSDSDDENEIEEEDGGETNTNAASESFRPMQKRKRVVSEDEDDDDDDSDQENEEESGEEPDEGNAQKKPMSLAERLQLYRSENPVPADGAGSSADEDGNSNYNGNDETGGDGFYPTAEDDDDDGLIHGDDDDDISENDLILDMAEDEYEEDGQEW